MHVQAFRPNSHGVSDMLRSMTAYGRHGIQTVAGEYHWELRSVNNRYLEMMVRLPEEVRVLEPKVRDVVSKRLHRGKVDVTLRRQSRNDDSGNTLSVNLATVTAVAEALKQVSEVVPNVESVNPLEVLQWPGVLQPNEVDFTALHKELLKGFDDALDDFVASREREGEATAGLLRARVTDIEQRIKTVRVHRPEVVARQRDRLKQKLSELDIPADSHRLEQELLYVAQRLDIDEELDRLVNHLHEVRTVLERDDPVGRRLDFLMQELNREANTLGSKSSDIDTTGASVDIKVLIEQMREQVQNIE